MAAQTAAENAAQTAAAEVTAEVVGDWLDENIGEITGYVIDNSLTVANAAADAKKVGDEISDIKSVSNILSDWVCEQVEKDIVKTSNNYRLNESDGYCSSVSGYKIIKYTVHPGDIVKVISDDRFQFQSSPTVNISGTNFRIGSTYSTGEYYLAVPQSATYLIMSTPATSNAHVYDCSGNINDEIDMPDTPHIPVLEQGGINGGTGQNQSASNRLRTKEYISTANVTEIGTSKRSSYGFTIIWYADDKSFLASTGWMPSGTSVYNKIVGGYFRLVIGRTDDGNLTPQEDTGIYYLTDDVKINAVAEQTANVVKIPDKSQGATFEQGSIDGTTGQDSTSDKRIRTAGYIPTDGVTEIGTSKRDTYGFTVFKYADDYTFISTTGWMPSGVDKYTDISGAYFRVVIGRVNDASFTPSEDTGFYYKKEQQINTVVLEQGNRLESLDADDRVSIDVIKTKYSPDPMSSGCCFVGNELWSFAPSADDGSDTANVYVMAYDFSANTLTHVRTMTHNLGHVNSVAYCAETDTLICGNGSGNYTLGGKIFLLENLSQRGNTLNRSDCITIDVGMTYGFKVNAVWGESNAARYDIAYISTNDSHNIYRLQLGKGENDLGNGTIISGATGFNGTYKVTHSWEWGSLDAIGHDYANCVQGMVFWKNRLVWGYGHSLGLSIRLASLYNDGKIKIDGANYETLDGSGNLITRYMCGITKFGEFGEYLGICASNSLWVVKDW